MEILSNPTHLDRTNLVWEWKLDWDAKDTWWTNNWTATNVTWVASEKWYTSEVGSFNGTSSYINWIYPLAWVNNFYISAWIKTSDVANYRTIYSARATGINVEIWTLRINNTWKIEFSDQVATSTASNTTLSTGIWYHIVFIRKTNNTFDLYINWVLDKSFTNNVDATTDPTWETWPQIGKYSQSATQFWSGSIWLFRIWLTTLSQQQINSLYTEWLRRFWPKELLFNNTAFPKYSLPNLESWKVLEISKAAVSWTYYDQSGNGNNSTAVTSVTDTAVGLNNKMTFNGTTSYINFWNNSIVSSAYTFISRVKPTLPSSWTYDMILTKYWAEWSTTWFYYWIYNASWTIQIIIVHFASWTYTQVDWNIPMVSTNYYDLALTWDWTSSALYVDWILISSQANSRAITNWTHNLTCWISSDLSSHAFWWDIIKPIIYNRALSAKEVQQDYYSNFIAN